MRVLAITLTVAACAVLPDDARADAYHVRVGAPSAISLRIPDAARFDGSLRYEVTPAEGVRIVGSRSGILKWNAAAEPRPALRLQLLVEKAPPADPFTAARVLLLATDGSRTPLDVVVTLSEPQASAGQGGADIEAELIPVPRAAAPGNVVKLLYTVFGYNERDLRIRLHVDAGPGWRLLDPETAAREMLLEAWEDIEGELYLIVPEQATVGERQLVRLRVEVVGEPGGVEALNHVSVVSRGGARPGVPTMTGSSTLGASQLGVGGADAARRSAALTLASSLGDASTFSLSFDQGIRENLSNYRYEEERTRLSGLVRHAGWNVSFGNYLSAQGDAITGPYVRGRGASLSRPAGSLVTELVVAQPNALGGTAGGHLVRGRAGIRARNLTLALAASDFGRPVGGYTTLSNIQAALLDADTEEQRDFERRLTAGAASNRVRGIGIDAEFRPARAHRMTFRTGGLWLSNAAGARAGARSGEASYALTTQPATFTVRWRETPPTVPGIYIPGDELAADGSVRLPGALRLVGSAYRSSTDSVGSDFASRAEGGSLGVRLQSGARRFEVRASLRESQYSRTSVRRTLSITGGTPLGPFTLNGIADVGREDTGTRVGRTAFYRGDLRWIRSAGTITLSGSHSETSGISRQRVDLIASLRLAQTEIAGGAWATDGYTAGGRPGAWTSLGVPAGRDTTITVGVDYSPLTWIAEPSLRGMVSVRKRFSVSMPFVRPTPIPSPPSLADRAQLMNADDVASAE